MLTYINRLDTKYILGDLMETNALAKGVLSFIIPGAGQYFNNDKKKAIEFFAIMIALHFAIYFLANNVFGSALSTLYHLYAGFDAYKNA